MKCQECGKNEVTFMYEKNVNGHVTTMRLCSECAQKKGLLQNMDAHSLWDGMFGGSFWDSAFTPLPSLFGRMNRLLENPFDDFFADMPAIGTGRAAEPEKPQQDTLVDEQEQKRFAQMRQLNALRMEMQQAVAQENFEQAAKLRDQIHTLEAENRQQP